MALVVLTGCQQQATPQVSSRGTYTQACHSQAQWLAKAAQYQRTKEGAFAANDDLFANFVQSVRPAGVQLAVFSYQRTARGVRITVYCPEPYSVDAQ
jgi:outer membrane biogenesis lipoprotein LolB